MVTPHPITVVRYLCADRRRGALRPTFSSLPGWGSLVRIIVTDTPPCYVGALPFYRSGRRTPPDRAHGSQNVRRSAPRPARASANALRKPSRVLKISPRAALVLAAVVRAADPTPRSLLKNARDLLRAGATAPPRVAACSSRASKLGTDALRPLRRARRASKAASTRRSQWPPQHARLQPPVCPSGAGSSAASFFETARSRFGKNDSTKSRRPGNAARSFP